MTNKDTRLDGVGAGARKSIERAVADDLIAAIYKVEGWAPKDRAGFTSRVARCSSLYAITADARRNRYVATPYPVSEEKES